MNDTILACLSHDKQSVPPMPSLSLSTYSHFWYATFSFTYLLFPLFLYVAAQNREADKLTLVYPIIQHFHIVVKAMLIYFALITLPILLFILIWPDPYQLAESIKSSLVRYLITIILGGLFLLISAIGALLLILVPNVQYILHFLLALQRFLIYFNPEHEKLIRLSEKKLRVLLIFLYFISLLLGIRSILIVFKAICDIRTHTLIDFSIPFLLLNTLQIIGALLYIPIMISLSKLTHLQSAAMQKPHKYVFYQIIVHLVSRICFLPIFLSRHFTGSNYFMGLLIIAFDISMTPLTIQLAYLLCNRKNVQVLFAFPPLEIVKRLGFPNYRVGPVHPESELQSTATRA